MEIDIVKILGNKKLMIIISFFLLYFFLLLIPRYYALRFTIAMLSPFVAFTVYTFLKIIRLRCSLLKNALLHFLGCLPTLMVILLVFFTPLIPATYVIFVGDAEIRSTVEEMVANISDSELRVRRIMDWEINNLTNMYGKESNFILDIPMIWERVDDPSWIFFYKRGNCGEYATLFVKMAEFAGVQSRCVYNPAEDHRWAQVFIDNTWVPIDPSANTFINPENYENERDIPMSYVYVVENDKVVDITSQYTATGRLIVRVLDDNQPRVGAKITVESRLLMERLNNYDSPRSIVPEDKQMFITNENGEYVFNLGGNNYTVTAEFGAYKVENNITVEENRDNPLTIYFSF